MRLPIRVVGTKIDDDGKLNVLFNQTYGFSYAGSLANAITFKQLVEDLLVDVQYVATDVPLSFEELCKFLCHFCALVSTEIVSKLAEGGRFTFLIAGMCPLKSKLRGAIFHLAQVDGKTSVSFDEVVLNEGEYIAVGSGRAQFNTLFSGKKVTMSTVLLTLNQVIDEEKVDSVGGDIQYGTFGKDGNFAVSGLVRISIEKAIDEGRVYGPSEERVMKYRGFELYKGWNIPGEKFWPSPSFIEIQVPSNKESEARFIEKCRMTIAEKK